MERIIYKMLHQDNGGCCNNLIKQLSLDGLARESIARIV